MKITALSADALELKEDGKVGVAIGAVMLCIGLLLGLFAPTSFNVGMMLGVLLAFTGLLLVLLSSSITLSANRHSGQIRYGKKRLVGNKESTYAIAEVARVETRQHWRTDESRETDGSMVRKPILISQSLLVFRDGKDVTLSHEQSASGTSAKITAQAALASQVARFMNVPFQEIAPGAKPLTERENPIMAQWRIRRESDDNSASFSSSDND